MTFFAMQLINIILIMYLKSSSERGQGEIRHFGNSNRNPILRLLSSKTILLVLATVLVTGSAVGGTVAWLMSRPQTLTNTFTIGNVQIILEETDTNDGDSDPRTNTYEMMPGRTIEKDPKVTVSAGSDNCWLFVKLTEKNHFANFMTYSVEDGWTALGSADGVYYREVSQSDADQAFLILSQNAVQVKAEVTTEMFRALTPDTLPVLSVDAYAVQREGIESAEAAWQLVK